MAGKLPARQRFWDPFLHACLHHARHSPIFSGHASLKVSKLSACPEGGTYQRRDKPSMTSHKLCFCDCRKQAPAIRNMRRCQHSSSSCPSAKSRSSANCQKGSANYTESASQASMKTMKVPPSLPSGPRKPCRQVYIVHCTPCCSRVAGQSTPSPVAGNSSMSGTKPAVITVQ